MIKMKKLIGISLMALVAVTFLSSTAPVSPENIGDWIYRCAIYIDNTNNPQELIYYQVPVELDSSNFNFSRAQPDGDDLRFTNQSGGMLDYWIESYDSVNEKAKIWVEVDNIPASDITSIIMYYGNPAAFSASSGTATFNFFDDFSSNTLTIDNSGDPCTATKPLPQQVTDNFMVIFTAKKVRQGWCADLSFGLRDTLGRRMSARYYWCDKRGNYQLIYPSSSQKNHYQPSNGFLHKTTLSKIGSTYEKIVYDMSGKVVNTLTGTDGIPDAVFDEVYFTARKHTVGYISYDSKDGGYYDLSGMKDAYSTFYVYNMKIRKYTDPEPTISIEEDLSDWNYRLSIIIDNTNNPQELIYYQVPVELDSSNFNFSRAQPDGDDLRFTNQSGGKLPHWIESYDSVNEKAGIWVKVDFIRASTTTSIIMYYGNPAAFDASDFDATFTKNSVLDGLIALWHMDKGSGTVIADSSGNGNDGTFYTDDSPAWAGSDGGRWDGITQQFCTGDSLDFDGIDDYVSVISVADDIASSDTVFAFWMKGDGPLFTTCKHHIFRDYFRIQSVDGRIHVTFRPSNNFKWCIKTENTYPLDEWVFVVLGHDGVEPYLYVNGALAAITFTNCFPGTLDRTYYFDDYGAPTRIDLGAFRDKGNPYAYYPGEIDEARIYGRTLLPGEIAALYERREYTDPEPSVRIEMRTMSIWDGGSRKISCNQMLRPLASFRIRQAEHLKEEAYLLLQEATQEGSDISEVQPLVESADNFFADARKFYSSGNYIAANNLALQAISLYEQAIETLELLK